MMDTEMKALSINGLLSVGDSTIVIEDHIEGYQGQEIYSYIHFHPACHVEQAGENTYLIDKIKINISGGDWRRTG